MRRTLPTGVNGTYNLASVPQSRVLLQRASINYIIHSLLVVCTLRARQRRQFMCTSAYYGILL